MPYLRVRQKVEDFNRWHAIFASHAEAQTVAGLKGLQLLRDATDPSLVVCFFGVDDVETARAFTETPDVSDAQRHSGIIGTPEVLLLEEI